jgi:hypothetical protein
VKPRCHFCGADCTDADHCHGCHATVCAACDHPHPNQRPQGAEHEPEAHRAHVVVAKPLCACGKPAVLQGRCRGCDEDHFYGRDTGDHIGVE